ncbi:MAG: hypothetical protein ACYDB2_04950 [Acidimicrobiales bacterium]
MKLTLNSLRPFAVVTIVVASLATASSLFVTATARAATVPECSYSTMKASVGATYVAGAGYVAGTRLVPIFFTNRGVACHLPLSGPKVIAFREAHVGKRTITQNARPAVWKERWVVLATKARVKELLEVVALPSATLKSRACAEATASGIIIEGFGQPVAKWIYFARSLPGVCFYSGPSPATTNVKEVWVGAK